MIEWRGEGRCEPAKCRKVANEKIKKEGFEARFRRRTFFGRNTVSEGRDACDWPWEISAVCVSIRVSFAYIMALRSRLLINFQTNTALVQFTRKVYYIITLLPSTWCTVHHGKCSNPSMF